VATPRYVAPPLDQLQHAAQHTDDGPERPVLALEDTTQAIVVAEELIRTVDKANDHERTPATKVVIIH
jgi:hypothetical protein